MIKWEKIEKLMNKLMKKFTWNQPIAPIMHFRGFSVIFSSFY